MAEPIIYRDVQVQPGSQLHEALSSNKKEDQQRAKRMFEYTAKCAACFYSHAEILKLRAEYADVI